LNLLGETIKTERAPILATVEREGVVYATVYDLRGRAAEPLTTQPPP